MNKQADWKEHWKNMVYFEQEKKEEYKKITVRFKTKEQP